MTGVKEETTGVLKLNGNSLKLDGNSLSAEIDFGKAEKGSNLWLFYQITDFGNDWENLAVLLTPIQPTTMNFNEFQRISKSLIV